MLRWAELTGWWHADLNLYPNVRWKYTQESYVREREEKGKRIIFEGRTVCWVIYTYCGGLSVQGYLREYMIKILIVFLLVFSDAADLSLRYHGWGFWSQWECVRSVTLSWSMRSEWCQVSIDKQDQCSGLDLPIYFKFFNDSSTY